MVSAGACNNPHLSFHYLFSCGIPVQQAHTVSEGVQGMFQVAVLTVKTQAIEAATDLEMIISDNIL